MIRCKGFKERGDALFLNPTIFLVLHNENHILRVAIGSNRKR